MSIDITKERIVSFREAAKEYCPRRRHGRKPHVSTFYRWAAMGLETIRVGGQLCTSAEALQRFFDRSKATSTSHQAVPRPTRDRNQVEQDLVALGL
jgi:hypothetical protein